MIGASHRLCPWVHHMYHPPWTETCVHCNYLSTRVSKLHECYMSVACHHSSGSYVQVAGEMSASINSSWSSRDTNKIESRDYFWIQVNSACIRYKSKHKVRNLSMAILSKSLGIYIVYEQQLKKLFYKKDFTNVMISSGSRISQTGVANP